MICRLCPRNCGALRTPTEGQGLCRMPQAPVLARAALHHWEEPPILPEPGHQQGTFREGGDAGAAGGDLPAAH